MHWYNCYTIVMFMCGLLRKTVAVVAALFFVALVAGCCLMVMVLL